MNYQTCTAQGSGDDWWLREEEEQARNAEDWEEEADWEAERREWEEAAYDLA